MGSEQSAEHAGVRPQCGGRLSQAEGWLELVTRPACKLGIQASLRKKVARRALKLVVSLDVHQAERWRRDLIIGRALRLMGKHSRATKYLKSAANLNPENRLAWRLLAACYKRTGDLFGAISVLGTSVTYNPDDAFLHFDLARYLSLYGALDRALVEIRWALDLEPALQKRLLRERDFARLHEVPEFQVICRETV